MGKQYSKEEVEFLRANCSKMNAKELSIAVGRDKQSIYAKLRNLWLKLLPEVRGIKWTAEQEKRIIAEYPTANLKELAKDLGVKYYTLLEKASKLGVGKVDYQYWTRNEQKKLVDYLKSGYAVKQIAGFLNRNVHSVYCRIYSIGESVKSLKKADNV